MPREPESDTMDLDTLERYLWWAAAIGWTITFGFILGELRGWWNDAGEIGATVGSILSGLLTVVAILLNATKGQVSAIRRGVTDNGRRLGLIHEGVRGVNEGLGGVNEGLGDVNEGLGGVNESVRNVEEGVRALDERLGGVEEGVRQLHEDNERQTDVLEQIRDRL